MGEYGTFNGLRTYYEAYGAGDPVLLLHGGGVTADSWWGQIPALSEHYRVYAPERRGHGRTQDLEGPITSRLMAADTAALIETLCDGRPAHVIGWSDGAKVALRLALDRPELVRKLVVIGLSVSRDGDTPAAAELMHGPGSEQALEEMFRPQYEPLSPDGPGHFPVVFAKLLEMWRTEPDLAFSELAALPMPTLVMQGDDDGVRVEHSAALAAAVPGAQLAVVPGTSHALPLEKPALVGQLLLDFLADEQTRKLMPLGSGAQSAG
ncbi:alpha/beta fold hydrolase [Streptomyces sp. NBC_01465]|uniref:alpha/beta fold hydrolase n=1 Tax=Streptomyces sp. NBC_01465 TaxID=2903878 RepID=UPI002E35281B|nr:alpha/beta hydrolase [Streptomyces sp. NBC_01465]